MTAGRMTKNLCYELYKIDWEESHGITFEMKANSIRDYYKYLIDEEEYSYEDYLNDFGYNGEIYVCFNEFCDNEFLDKEYMENLLKDKVLIGYYHKALYGFHLSGINSKTAKSL